MYVHIYLGCYIYVRVAKKGGKTSKSKILKKGEYRDRQHA